MNTMNMPGFTAEASLYKTNGHYRLTTRSAGRADAHLGLRPARPCHFRCRMEVVKFVCRGISGVCQIRFSHWLFEIFFGGRLFRSRR